MTLPELVARIEILFECKDGPYQSYVMHNGMPFDYVTLAWRAPNHPGVVYDLRDQIHKQFCEIAESLPHKAILYWRFSPEQRIGEEENHNHTSVMIRTRVAIPDYDWSKIQVVVPFAEIPRLPK